MRRFGTSCCSVDVRIQKIVIQSQANLIKIEMAMIEDLPLLNFLRFKYVFVFLFLFNMYSLVFFPFSQEAIVAEWLRR